MNDLVEMFQVSRVAIYDWIEKEGFPKPLKIGRSARWIKKDIEVYINDKNKA
jgi:predicted DNA-binding transcriptional regulator AlpA